MEFENEKINEEKAAEQQHTTDHENSGYQGYRPGRSPRPRIHQQTRPYNQGSFNRNQEEGGFRPEGFGAGLQNAASQPREYNQQHIISRPKVKRLVISLVSSMVSLVRAVISNVVVTASPVRVAISLVSSMVSPVSSMVSLVRVVISSVAVTASPVRVVMVSSVAVIASILLAMIPMQNIA